MIVYRSLQNVRTFQVSVVDEVEVDTVEATVIEAVVEIIVEAIAEMKMARGVIVGNAHIVV